MGRKKGRRPGSMRAAPRLAGGPEVLAWGGSPAHPTDRMPQCGKQTAQLSEGRHAHPSLMPLLILTGHFLARGAPKCEIHPAVSIKQAPMVYQAESPQGTFWGNM